MQYADIDIPPVVIIDPDTGFALNAPLGDQVPPGWEKHNQEALSAIIAKRAMLGIVVEHDDFNTEGSVFDSPVTDALADKIAKDGLDEVYQRVLARVEMDKAAGETKRQKAALLAKLDGIIAELEEKSVVRHVRTPAGARKYGQPIGSVIIADNIKTPGSRLTNINFRQRWKKDSAGKIMRDSNGDKVPEDDGYDLYVGANGQQYWVYEDDKGWVAVDDENEFLHEADTEAELLQAMDAEAANMFVAADRGSRPHPDMWGGELGPNWRPVTGDDYNKGLLSRNPLKPEERVPITPAYVDVWINTDPDGEPLYVGFDGADRLQRVYSTLHHMRQAAIKQKRVETLKRHITKLDAAVDADWRTDDNAKAVMLMRRMGMRPGSTTDTRAVVQAFGATTLEARHITINKDSVTFDFIGKKGKRIHLNTKDPAIIEMIKVAKGNKKNRDRLFPGATAAKASEYMSQYIPADYTPKDLRTYRATEVALFEVKKIKRQPKSRAEFIRHRNAIGDTVAAELGNLRAQSLKSYINPTIFDLISKENPEWSAEFARQILGGDDGDE